MAGFGPVGSTPVAAIGGTGPTSTFFTLNPGVYAITGSPAGLKVGRILRTHDNNILNGEFTFDTSHWNVAGADTTFASVDGVGDLELGPAAAGGYAWQAVAVVPGQRYTLSAFLKPRNAYALTATPGSYAVAGTDAVLTYASGGGGGGSPAVTFSGDSMLGTQYARWTLSFDGYTYKQHNAGAAVQAGPWIVPQIGMGGYEVRATLVSGDTPAGTLNTWLSFGQTWGFSAVFTDHECVLLIEIRDAATLVVVASGDVDIFAAGLA